MRRRRRRLALVVLGLLLLGSCTAAGLSVAGRDRAGTGTVTAHADVGGVLRPPGAAREAAAGPAAPGPPAGAAALAGPAAAPPAAAGMPAPARPPARRGTGGTSPSRATTVTAGDVGSAVLVTLSGSTAGLVPGRPGQLLQVVVGNDAANADDLLLTLTSVGAVVRGPAGSCGPEDLLVTPYRAGPGAPTYTVRRGRSVVVALEVVFVDRLDRDQTDCAGATFPLTLTATAEVSP